MSVSKGKTLVLYYQRKEERQIVLLPAVALMKDFQQMSLANREKKYQGPLPDAVAQN